MADETPPLVVEPDGWVRDRAGKEYIAGGRPGAKIYRRANETVEEARARDQAARDVRPKSKPKVPRAPAPTRKSLKELEHLLAQALAAPAMPFAMFGETWTADHFTATGPALARNLVAAAEHNDWLRKRLELMAAGEDISVKLMSTLPLFVAVVAYVVPPLGYYGVLPLPPEARVMLRIPDRPVKEPENAATASTAPTAPAETPEPIAA